MHMQPGVGRTQLLRGHRSAHGAKVFLQLEQVLQRIQRICPRAPRYKFNTALDKLQVQGTQIDFPHFSHQSEAKIAYRHPVSDVEPNGWQ